MATVMTPQGPAASTPPVDDLEALFDQVSAEYQAKEEAVAAPAPMAPGKPARPEVAAGAEAEPYDVFVRVGNLTRQLHDALRELGYEKAVEDAVGSLPDARSRLHYIATLTGQAAERVLGATERGQAANDEVEREAADLAVRWDRVYANEMDLASFRRLADDSRAYLHGMAARTGANRELFTEIMMSQDFHDLTGQVIQRVVAVAESLEKQLVKLLIETTPPERRGAAEGFLSGPAVPGTRDDVVTSQAQVDDLLESLGF